jgi:alpha-L-arabinofuranosidase
VKGSTLTLTIVNSNANEATETTVRLLGGSLKEVARTSGLVFPDGDIQAHNTVENPDVVTLGAGPEVVLQGEDRFLVTLPPASVTKLIIEL